MGIEWGDVATWVTGVTSILLFIVAFWQIRLERSARRAAEAERSIAERRDQAERIAAWIETEFPGEHDQMMCVAVSNQSLQPIYHVVGILAGCPLQDPPAYRLGNAIGALSWTSRRRSRMGRLTTRWSGPGQLGAII